MTGAATAHPCRREKAFPAALGRRFEAGVFDWDGTAAMERAGLEPATPSLQSWCSPN